jgi:hypothetical protein
MIMIMISRPSLRGCKVPYGARPSFFKGQKKKLCGSKSFKKKKDDSKT